MEKLFDWHYLKMSTCKRFLSELQVYIYFFAFSFLHHHQPFSINNIHPPLIPSSYPFSFFSFSPFFIRIFASRLYIYIYIYAPTDLSYTHTHTHTYIYICMYIYKPQLTYRTHTHTHTHTHIYIYTYTYDELEHIWA